MKVVWSDEPCDRTEDHEGVNQTFFKRYGVKLEDWKKIASRNDCGDAMFYIGYLENPKQFGIHVPIIEVVIACDGNQIREHQR